MPWQEKMAVAIAKFTGSLPFVYLHIVVYGLWIAINCGWLHWLPRFDPSLVILAMTASVEAIFLSSFILIMQNRMMAEAERRADLSLQISLLAEHEVTRLLVMVKEIGKRMGVKEAEQPELEELARDVVPEEVLETMDSQAENLQRERPAA